MLFARHHRTTTVALITLGLATCVTVQADPVDAPEVAAPAQMQGQVVQTQTVSTPATAVSPAISNSAPAEASYQQPLQVVLAEQIAVEKTPVAIQKYSPKKFAAMRVRICNQSSHHIEVLQATVPQALSEVALAEDKAQSGQTARRGIGALLRVASSAVPYIGGYGSYAAYQAMAVGSNVAYQGANLVESSGGNVSLTGRYVQRVANVMIAPGQANEFEIVVSNGGLTPTVQMTVKDLVTNQVIDLSK